MISEEAIEAAAEWLPHSDDCEVRPERYCTCWRPRLALMRAALEAAAAHMQPVVATREELDALPWRSVIRSDEGTVFEKFTMWHEAGSRDLKYSPDIALPATVLQVGWGAE